MAFRNIIMVVVFAGVALTGLTACEKDGSAEKAGAAIDEAASDMTKGASETMETIKEKVETIKEKVKE
jgi:hypothetical protein